LSSICSAVTYTHPDVFTIGVRDGWADPVTDPTLIDWPARQAVAAIPFQVVNGRPVNPHAPTGIHHGRNELGHWGEQLAADALVYAYAGRQRRMVMVERSDGHGWALPGGYVEPGEDPLAAAQRELDEETGLQPFCFDDWQTYEPIYVPDPRASDESWMVTVPASACLGWHSSTLWLPDLAGADDALRAAWMPADSYDGLVAYLADTYQGVVFPAHRDLLAEFITAQP
jgi:ADP-ribose pyrophosphatase